MSDKNEAVPEWRKAWKLDDPEWVKQRKKDWRAIKRSPAYINASLRSKEKKLLKNFFMTGVGIDPIKLQTDPERCDFDNSPLQVQARPLYEIWLCANQTEERVQFILERNKHSTNSARKEFSRLMSLYDQLPTQDELATEGSMFAGSDERVYRALAPTHLFATDKRDAYSQEAIESRGAGFVGSYMRLIINYMKEDYYPQNIAPILLDEWLLCLPQSVIHAKSWKDGLEHQGGRYPLDYFDLAKKNYLERALHLINNPNDFDAVQIDFAKRIIEGFRTMTVNDEVDQHVKELLKDIK